MIRFILLTLAVLAVAFWIASGGSDFEPEQLAEAPQPVETPAPPVTEPAPEPQPVQPVQPPAPQPAAQPDPQPESQPATRPDPQPVAQPVQQPDPQPVAQPAQETAEPMVMASETLPAPDPQPADTQPATDPLAAALTEALAQPDAPATPDPAPAPATAPARPLLDLRMVDADRVNLRAGPSTDNRIVDRLARGTAVEIKEVDLSGDEPWVRLRVLATGLEGWMAERFLIAQ